MNEIGSIMEQNPGLLQDLTMRRSYDSKEPTKSPNSFN